MAIPTEGNNGIEDKLCDHLGKALTFTIADLVNGHLTVIDNYCEHKGGQLSIPELLRGAGVDTVVVAKMGAKAASLFEELGITVLCGASGSVREVIAQLKAGSLTPPTVEAICEKP